MTNVNYWLGFIAGILYVYVIICCYNQSLNIKKAITYYDWTIIIICSLTVSLNSLYNHIALIVPSSFAIMFILFYLIFREKVGITFYKTLYIAFVAVLAEFILSIIMLSFVSNIEALNTQIPLKFLFTIVMSHVLYFIFKIKWVCRLGHKVVNRLLQSKIIVYISILGFCILAYNYLIYTLDLENILLYFVSLFLTIIIIICSYFYFKQLYDNKLLELRNKYLEENLDLFKDTLKDYRECKHNIINDFLFIKTLCDTETQELIDVKMVKYYKDRELINNIKDIPKGFQGLIYAKWRIAKKYKIELILYSDCSIGYKNLGYKLYVDLCEVVSLALDNAIEAAKDSKIKAIFFDIQKAEKNNIKINVTNTFSNTIDLNLIGEKNYSTKNRNSGVGLNYMQRLNKNIQIEKEIAHNLFKVNINIQIKKA